jgi:hypothetical protein
MFYAFLIFPIHIMCFTRLMSLILCFFLVELDCLASALS